MIEAREIALRVEGTCIVLLICERRHDIKPQQIYTWRRKLAADQAGPVVSFLLAALIATPSSDEAELPVPVKPTTKRSARPMRIEIGCKGGQS